MADDLLTLEQFGQSIKAKYPDYAAVPDAELATKMLAKYPEYQSRVKVAPMNTATVNGQPVPVEGSAIGRFAEGAAKNLNPIAAVEGAASAVRHPIDTMHGILSSQGAQLSKAKDLYDQGRTTEAAGHLLAGLLPILGPAAAAAGERIASGDIAGGLGESFGILAPFGAAKAIKAAGSMVPEGAADALKAGATSRVADVMAPKVGANKVRFGNLADQVAPKLVEAGDVKGWTREGLQTHLEGKLAEAETALDEAANQRLGARSVPTQPLINDLLEKRKRFTAEAVKGSQFESQSGVNRPPIGKDVIPGPNGPRVAAIDEAIAEIRQLGPVSRYEPLRRIREAYDQPAKVKYNPSMTQDFLKQQGYANGAADVTSTLRDALGKLDPETAAANAQYSLYRKATDVLKATEEVERTRPKVGRQIMARLTGSVIGEGAAGVPGAAAGFVLGPLVDQALSSGLTTKLQTARLMASLAEAIQKGDVGRVTGLSYRIKALTRTAQAGAQIDQQAPSGSDVLSPTAAAR